MTLATSMRKIAVTVKRFGTAFFFGLMLVGVTPLFLIESEFNAPFVFALKYLSIPIVVIFLSFGLIYRDVFQSDEKKGAYWFGLIAHPLLATLWSGGFVLLANATFPPQRNVVIDGVVQRKEIAGGRYKSHVVDVATSAGLKRIEINPYDYERLNVGAEYHSKWKIGPLGFAYRWK